MGEGGAGAVDFIEADLEDEEFAGLFLDRVGGVDASAEVDGFEVVVALAEAFGEFREDDIAEVVSFGVHIAEGAADKDRSGVPGGACAHRWTTFLAVVRVSSRPAHPQGGRAG